MLAWLTKPNDLAQRVVIRCVIFSVSWMAVGSVIAMSEWLQPLLSIMFVPVLVIAVGSFPWSILSLEVIFPGATTGGPSLRPWWFVGLCLLHIALCFAFNTALIALAFRSMRDKVRPRILYVQDRLLAAVEKRANSDR